MLSIWTSTIQSRHRLLTVSIWHFWHSTTQWTYAWKHGPTMPCWITRTRFWYWFGWFPCSASHFCTRELDITSYRDRECRIRCPLMPQDERQEWKGKWLPWFHFWCSSLPLAGAHILSGLHSVTDKISYRKIEMSWLWKFTLVKEYAHKYRIKRNANRQVRI